MSGRELKEHSLYLADTHKIRGYAGALDVLLAHSDAAVLDLGAGSGILGLLAARAGARRVYCVDSGSIVGPAAEVAARSEYADRISHIRACSVEVELPELVDVAVCDQIGGFVYDAGVLEYFADVRRRLLAPDGVLVPTGFRLYLAPAECSAVREQIDVWGSAPAGLDFAVFRDLAINTEHRVEADEVRLLGAAAQVAQISSDHTARIEGSGDAVIDEAGRCDGLVGFFEADLGGGITLTNHPTERHRIHRWCNFYPTAAGVSVRPGQTVHMEIDVRPLLPAVTWSVAVRSAPDDRAPPERHSTLLGAFVAGDDLQRAAGNPIRSTPDGDVLARALTLADGSRSTDEVVAAALGSIDRVSDPASVESLVRRLLARLTVPTSM